MFNGSNMKKFILIVAIVMVASFIIAGMIFYAEYGGDHFASLRDDIRPGNAINVDEEKSAAVSSVKSISVDTSTENITFIPTDTSEIKAHYYGYYASSDKEFIPEFTVTAAGEELKIKIAHKSHFGSLMYSEDIKLDIYIPKSYSGNLQIDTSTANIGIDEMNLESFTCKTSTGDLTARLINARNARLDTNTGKMSINGTYDSFSFKSSTGDLLAENISSKNTKLDTNTGKITLKGLPGNVDGTSSTGSFSLAYNEFNNNINVHTSTGKTMIKLPGNAEFHLKFTTSVGNATCDFPMTVSGTQKRNNVEGTVVSDRNQITVNSSTGSLNITK